MKRLLLFSLCLWLCSCGTYRSGSSEGYRGMGDYRNPSDFSQGVDSKDFTPAEQKGPREKLNQSGPYFPRESFKLFWPVSLVHINRGFRPASDPRHEGLDLGGRRGMPILAAHEGVVIYAGSQFHGYGNMIIVEYNKEWATLYGHLKNFSIHQGQVVHAGDPLGGMGHTGHATGTHLHFELLHFSQPMDPLKLLTRKVDFAVK